MTDFKFLLTTGAFLLTAVPNFVVYAADTISDAESLKIVQTVNQGEIDLAKIAEKSKDPNVVSFAKQMIKQHSDSDKEVNALTKKISAKPTDSSISADLKTEAETKKKELSILKGADLDQKYIASQVEMHNKVLDLLDDRLIPAAQNAQLKELLTKTKTTVAAHKDHATKLQSELKKQ